MHPASLQPETDTRLDAVMFLLNNTEHDIRLFRQNIQLLEKNYLSDFPCDVLCFFESDFPRTELDAIRSLIKFEIKFIPFILDMPAYAKEIMDKIPPYILHEGHPNGLGFTIGYRKMCRFMAGEVFKSEHLKNYKYVWKLDTDSSILQKINYNIFDKMESHGATYGFINIQLDSPKMITGLWDRANKYLTTQNTDPVYCNINLPEHTGRVFYTNFEVFDMDWFRSGPYNKYYEFIESSGGILTHRWGDHCIRYIGVTALVPPEKIIFFGDVHYFHQGYYHNLRRL